MKTPLAAVPVLLREKANSPDGSGAATTVWAPSRNVTMTDGRSSGHRRDIGNEFPGSVFFLPDVVLSQQGRDVGFEVAADNGILVVDRGTIPGDHNIVDPVENDPVLGHEIEQTLPYA